MLVWVEVKVSMLCRSSFRKVVKRGKKFTVKKLAVYTQTLAFLYSLFYLQIRINKYKQTTKSTVCVNYDYATIRNTAAVQFCSNKSAKFLGKLQHITEQIYDFTQP